MINVLNKKYKKIGFFDDKKFFNKRGNLIGHLEDSKVKDKKGF